MSSRLTVISKELSDSEIWNNKPKLLELQKNQKILQNSFKILKKINDDIELVTYTLNSLIDDKIVEDNEAMIAEMRDIVISIEKTLKSMETRQMFRTKEDPMNAYIDIQSGSGGTEAQDWVAMLLRMYLRWLESHNFKNEIVEMS